MHVLNNFLVNAFKNTEASDWLMHMFIRGNTQLPSSFSLCTVYKKEDTTAELYYVYNNIWMSQIIVNIKKNLKSNVVNKLYSFIF